MQVLEAACRPCQPPSLLPTDTSHTFPTASSTCITSFSTPCLPWGCQPAMSLWQVISALETVSGEQGRAACKLPAERRRRQGGWQPPSKSGCSSSPCALLKAAAQRRALSLPESRFSCSLGALSSPVPAAPWVVLWAGWEG